MKTYIPDRHAAITLASLASTCEEKPEIETLLAGLEIVAAHPDLTRCARSVGKDAVREMSSLLIALCQGELESGRLTRGRALHRYERLRCLPSEHRLADIVERYRIESERLARPVESDAEAVFG